ncbi:cupin-like domain-containing protein [Legionella sp. 227]|uniref:cupin-like domain-containing protein n=1 Tax=Legionella sp. 227 TaxID=3367288 RepID=UPI00370D7EC7
MKIMDVKTIDYFYGDEENIKNILYKSKEPLLIKIKNFRGNFDLDYFEKHIQADTTYATFENNRRVAHQPADFGTIIAKIKQNMPYRIFGQILTEKQSAEIEKHIPLWQHIPLRPRYFNKTLKVIYFFGGQNTHTYMHYDREHCSNLHVCLSGRKRFLLFTQDQSEALYKLPFVSDSLIDFSRPLEEINQQYPRSKQAQGYRVTLEKGDMLFMPRNCWHYTEYLEPSSSACYIFYPQKILHIYGYFTGYFFLGFKEPTGFLISNWPFVKKFSERYALATGVKKFLMKMIEFIIFPIILPIVSILALIAHKLKPRRVY